MFRVRRPNPRSDLARDRDIRSARRCHGSAHAGDDDTTEVLLRRLIPLAAGCATLAVAPAAHGSGGDYVFAGGTAAQQKTVVAALEASSFPWSIAPGTVVVHIERGTDSRALPGHVWLDADLLDAGRFSWGVVQHEYAHEVDFLLLDDTMRDRLHQSLGGVAWWTGAGHEDRDCERFADLVAWSFWQSPDNVMKPESGSGHMTPAAFRSALAAVLPVRFAASVTVPRGSRRR
jgi:hypothetical protein